MIAVVVAQGAAILLLGTLVLGLLRSHAEILKALHDLGAGLDLDDDRRPAAAPGPVSSPVDGATNDAHDVSGTLIDGSVAGIAVNDVQHDTLLAFLSTNCAGCQPFWEAFGAGVALPERTRLVVVVQDHESTTKLRKKASSDLLVVRSDEAWSAYDVPGSPHFVYVDGTTGQVAGEGTGDTWDQVADLIDQAGGGRATGRRRTAPQPLDPADDPTHRDDPGRIDQELRAAGIGPGHYSLYAPLDDETTGRNVAAADVEAG